MVVARPLRTLFVLGCSALVASLVLVGAPAPADAAHAQSTTDDEKGADLYGQICGDCHDSDRIVSTRRTKAEWQDIINQMIDKGASGSGEQFETVFGYLQRHFGKVYVNTAPAAEIATALGLTPAEADAVVAYRKANGPFADFDALKKVPEIDAKQLDAHKQAAAF